MCMYKFLYTSTFYTSYTYMYYDSGRSTAHGRCGDLCPRVRRAKVLLIHVCRTTSNHILRNMTHSDLTSFVKVVLIYLKF